MAKDILKDACEAYNIPAEAVLSNRVADDKKSVVIVTAGGSKVTYDGSDVTPLTTIQATGVNPAPKKKPLVGKARNKQDS